MTLRTKLIFLGLLFSFTFLFWTGSLQAQSFETQTLRTMGDEFHVQFYTEKALAVQKARKMNLPIRGKLKDGRVYELMSFQGQIPRYYITNNLQGAELINTNSLWPDGAAGLDLAGSGQTLGIWDGGAVLKDHQELLDRVEQLDDYPMPESDHPTHVAATMIAQGVDPAARGMSWQARLNAYDWNNDNSEMASAAADDLLVSNHSYGQVAGWAYGDWSGNMAWHWFGDVSISETEDNNFGFYDITAKQWDDIACNAPSYLIVKSAGNDRNDSYTGGHYYWDSISGWTYSQAYREKDGGSDGYDSIPTYGNAKNIVTVGAVNASRNMSLFSGWGPADDGRIKPDIVAKGVAVYSAVDSSATSYDTWDGTSMSSPMVSGSVGLLAQHQENLYGSGSPFRSSTIKALIIHGADDSIGGDPGPDYRFGWGLMDTQRSAEIMSLDSSDGEGLHIHELSLNEGDEIVIPVVAAGSEPLRATIVWTDPPGTPPAPSLNPSDLMLVNDLDLRILNQSGEVTGKPYILDPEAPSEPAVTGDNYRDNVEMVHIQEPAAGATYLVRICHKDSLDSGSQNVSLIITGNQASSDTGFIKINIEPDGAINAGAKWRRTGTSSWLDSGYTESGVAEGDYTVEFKDITCWDAPDDIQVQVNEGETTSATETYVRHTGSLTVYITPQEAVDAGMQWRRRGTQSWHNSGATETGVPTGTYVIEFKAAGDYVRPATENVEVTKDPDAQLTWQYEELPRGALPGVMMLLDDE